MSSIFEIKEREITETPLLLCECALADGTIERWSTHAVTIGAEDYQARVIRHNVFEFRSYSDEGIDGSARVTLVLANADSHFSQVERSVGWKGAKLTVRFLFYDLKNQQPASEARVLFLGIGNPPEEITESTFRITFNNRLSLQRVALPDTRIQKRCPWLFPSNSQQREAAVSGASRGKFGLFYRCGYSPDYPSGCGNSVQGQPYVSCDYTRAQCEQRGMFDQDVMGRTTRRFGGVEFVPPSVTVRSYGEKGSHLSPAIDNAARYNDFVPIIYGTAWYNPPVVFARNDGNLTRLEVLLGAGEIQGVLRILANDIEIPPGRPGANMTGTGWYNLVSHGERSGAFNSDFADSSGRPLGDPYGSMAVLSLVVPNRISDGRGLPRVQVLLEGLKLDRWDVDSGDYLGSAFTNNPAWTILDVLRRSGWHTDDIDLPSFSRAAKYCDEQVTVTDSQGSERSISRYSCNLVIQKRRSAADIVRGIRTSASLHLTFGPDGSLQLRPEETFAVQQPVKPESSNASQMLNGGWPAYEFGDGTNGTSGILRRPDGSPDVRVWARSNADTTNRLSVEFQDEFNAYQQDSLSIVDSDDVQRTGLDVTTALNALGLPNVYQALKAARLQLDKSIRGNNYVEFSTSVRAFGLKPGDLITVTYLKEGWHRKPFRILKLAPGVNYEVMTITAQAHEDAWYCASLGGAESGTGQQPAGQLGIPAPLMGTVLSTDGDTQFAVAERQHEATDGGGSVSVTVSFVPPRKPERASIGAPSLSLRTEVANSGGTLKGGTTCFYAISGVDSSGAESGLSFLVRAEAPGTGNSSCVRLKDLHFAPGTATFRVYRGSDPLRLRRIADNLPLASEFLDTGFETQLAGPADPNYDHANFYWRFELVPEYTANFHSSVTVGHPDLRMISNEYAGKAVRITRGRGCGQERAVTSNTGDTLTITPKWDIEPDATSSFTVAEPSWIFAALSQDSPVEFEVPNRSDTTIQILGCSANILNRECPADLSPLARWRIGGAAGISLDSGVPCAPTFGLGLTGKGSIEIAGIGFTDMANTRTVSSGTLTVFCWDELSAPAATQLSSGIAPTDEYLDATVPVAVAEGDLIQIDREVLSVVEASPGGIHLKVTRASHGSAASNHEGGTPLYCLVKRVFVMPFPKDFFGSRASGSYSYPIRLPNVRIAAAELLVTNSRGDSPAGVRCYTQSTEAGLRTVAGGQFSIQVGDWLAIEDDAAPGIVVEETTAVRDVCAMVAEAPVGGSIEVHVRADDIVYSVLSITEGATLSNVVSGFGKAPLRQGSKLGVDIVSVPQSSGQLPGRDLTVTIRL